MQPLAQPLVKLRGSLGREAVARVPSGDAGRFGRLVVPEGTLVRVIDGEAVVLNLESERYYALDAVGTRVWQALSASGSVTGALERLRCQYTTDEATLRRDVEAFVDALLTSGLLVAPPS